MSLLAGNFSCIRYITHLDYLEKFGIVHSLNHHKVTVRSDFETGAFIQKFNPHVLLINLLAKGIDAAEICKSIRDNEDLQTIKVIALSNHLSDSESVALLKKGFDGCVSNSSDTTEVIRKIKEAIAIIY